MISSVRWIKKGVAKEYPIIKQMDDSQFQEIKEKMGMVYEDLEEDFQELQDAADETTRPEPDSIEERYNLNDYDKPTNSLFTLKDEEIEFEPLALDEEEMEEMMITPDDNLIIVGKTEDDVSQLEIYLYEREESNLYVHHDIMLSSFPLCTEWLGIRGGSYCAVGTFEPQIEIWNLDVYEPIFPEIILGDIPTESKGPTKKKHGPARVAKKIQKDRHVDAVMALSWNTVQQNLLLSGSADTTVKLWNIENSSCVYSFDLHSDKVQAVTWNVAEPTVFASGGYDKKVFVLDSRQPTQVRKFEVGFDVECMKWDPFDSQKLYCTTEDGTLHCFDARADKKLFTLQAHDVACTMDASPFHRGMILTASSDKSVKIWSTKNQKPKLVSQKEMEAGKVFAAEFSPDDDLTVSLGGSGGKVVVWNMESNAAVSREFPPKVKSASLVKEFIEVEPAEEEMDNEEDDVEVEDEDMESGDDV
jgi:periodic tryptophan protein 1